MKVKEFFLKKGAQGKISNEDATKAFEAIPDTLEIPDVWVNLFDDSFLTRERAETDGKITQKIKAETLNAVDLKVAKLIPLLDAKDKEEIEKETNSYKKLEYLEKAIPNLVEKVKSGNPNLADEIKEKNAKIQELADAIKAKEGEYSAAVENLKKTHTQEKIDLRVNWDLHEKISALKLADEFIDTPERKKGTIDYILHNVKSGNILNYDDQGALRVYENKNGAPTLKFNGNDQVTIDSLITSASNPFIKRNNGGQNGKQGGNNGQQPKTPASDKPFNQMTLAEMRQAQAAQANQG